MVLAAGVGVGVVRKGQTTMAIKSNLSWLALLTALLIAVAASAQEVVPPAEDSKTVRSASPPSRADEHMARIDVEAGRKGVKRIERPLLIFGDSARDNGDGTLWAWGESWPPARRRRVVFQHQNRRAANQRHHAHRRRDLVVAKTPTAESHPLAAEASADQADRISRCAAARREANGPHAAAEGAGSANHGPSVLGPRQFPLRAPAPRAAGASLCR